MSDSVCIILKHLVSSANINILDELIAEGRSFIYTRKSKGPSMLPCGTPDNTGRHLDKLLLIETH